jgi:hypothetical protein
LAHCEAECALRPTVCSPISVVANAKGKQRLVLDRDQYLPECKLKYEGLNLVPFLICCGDFFSTFDLKSGYHHVEIAGLI